MLALVLLLVAGLFLSSVILPPLAPPVHALNAPALAASQPPTPPGVDGTIASFAALFPDFLPVYLPAIEH